MLQPEELHAVLGSDWMIAPCSLVVYGMTVGIRVGDEPSIVTFGHLDQWVFPWRRVVAPVASIRAACMPVPGT
ncbi:uncharacterized protein H6S33_003620 [Morchella sextelata]|uniref:uncharacterized protein n=1 Tax=Morchella sextelata TaxID=1174677 RepID=UPI001D036138|nr:uncharacterized protein H6S33_003620 [Morchella sextelata]KAH0606786.1 hypothetical protein H6S33_003620 [Morchella sextelata]